jgi:hypothetical protein
MALERDPLLAEFAGIVRTDSERNLCVDVAEDCRSHIVRNLVEKLIGNREIETVLATWKRCECTRQWRGTVFPYLLHNAVIERPNQV